MDVEELSVQLSGKLDISITSVTTGDSDDSSTHDDTSEDVSSTTVSSSEASTANSIKHAMSSSMAELQAVASTQQMKLHESSLTKVTIAICTGNQPRIGLLGYTTTLVSLMTKVS